MIAMIQHDPDHPGFERRLVPELIEMGEHAQIGFLHQILSVGMGKAVRPSGFIQTAVVATDDILK